MTLPAERQAGVLMSRRHFVIGATLATASAASYAALPKSSVPSIPAKTFDELIPDKVGPWTFATVSGVVLPPPDALSDRLYDNLVSRVYESLDAPSVMLLIAYNNVQDGLLQVHRPEICYPASGYQLSATRPIAAHVGNRLTVPAQVFTAAGSDRVEHVLYWTRIAKRFPRSWLHQRLAVMRENLAGDVPDGTLVRVSILGGDQAGAIPVLEAFIGQFIATSPKTLRRVLLG